MAALTIARNFLATSCSHSEIIIDPLTQIYEDLQAKQSEEVSTAKNISFEEELVKVFSGYKQITQGSLERIQEKIDIERFYFFLQKEMLTPDSVF